MLARLKNWLKWLLNHLRNFFVKKSVHWNHEQHVKCEDLLYILILQLFKHYFHDGVLAVFWLPLAS